MSLAVEQVELMPAHEIPITIPVVGHQFTTASTADLPQQAAHAHIVGRINSRIGRHGGQASTGLQQVDADIQVILVDIAQLSLSLGIIQVDNSQPVDGSIGVILAGIDAVVNLHAGVVILGNVITCR